MIMFPAQNFFKQPKHDNGCGDFMSRIDGYDYFSEACLGSNSVVGHMAEEESRTKSLNEAESSSKEAQEERDEGWLQLGVGSYMTDLELKLDQAEPTAPKPVELDLLPGGRSSSSTNSLAQHVTPLNPAFHLNQFRAPQPITNTASASNSSIPSLLQHPRISLNFHPHEVTWSHRPNLWNTTASSSTTSWILPSLPGAYYAQQFQHPSVDLSYRSSGSRIIDAPPRQQFGVWFLLEASQNQGKEPFLPQIPKSYLRIKDGRITVRLVMKYLVSKLRLESESEEQIEITCRGQQLQPFLTLQHVRDNIWSSGDVVALLPESSATEHVMILHYGRSA